MQDVGPVRVNHIRYTQIPLQQCFGDWGVWVTLGLPSLEKYMYMVRAFGRHGLLHTVGDWNGLLDNY
jgi:hypothetical protein